MALHDPLFHPLFLGRRAAPETPPFDPFPPSGRKPWKGEPKARRDLEEIIALSQDIKSSSDRLDKAAARNKNDQP